MKSIFTKTSYLFLGLVLAAKSSVYGMAAPAEASRVGWEKCPEFKVRAAEQAESKEQAQATTVTIFSSQPQEGKLRAELGVGPEGWNAALLAQFYKDLEQLPAGIQRLVKEYILDAKQVEGPLSDALFGKTENSVALPEQDLSPLKEVERIRVLQKYAEDVCAVVVSNKEAERTLVLATPVDFMGKVEDLIFRSRLPQLMRLRRALPEAADKLLLEMFGVSEQAHAAHVQFNETCVGSCTLHMNLDSEEGLQVQRSTGIFVSVAQVIGAAHVSQKTSSDMLEALGFDSAKHSRVVTAVLELEQKLKTWLKEQKLAGTVLIELQFDKQKWQVTLKQKTLTIWSITWSENFNFTFYNGAARATAHVSSALGLGGDKLLLADMTHVHKKLHAAPLRTVALMGLIGQRIEECMPQLEEMYEKFNATESKQEDTEPLDADAERARTMEKSRRFIAFLQREIPFVDDMVDYWRQFILTMSESDKATLAQNNPWIQKILVEAENKKS